MSVVFIFTVIFCMGLFSTGIAQLPLIQREDIGKPITEFEHLRQFAIIDGGYSGEIWIFEVNGYDFPPIENKVMKYYFHVADNYIPFADTLTLVGMSFTYNSHDSVTILNAVNQFTQIIRDNGNPSFHVDLINGGKWPGAGGSTTKLTKVYKTEVPHLVPDPYDRLNSSGTLIVSFYSDGDYGFHTKLNFYPKASGFIIDDKLPFVTGASLQDSVKNTFREAIL